MLGTILKVAPRWKVTQEEMGHLTASGLEVEFNVRHRACQLAETFEVSNLAAGF